MNMSKQIKSILKTAKQCIQEKKYDEALVNCKSLLSFDPENYNGLVFCGLCLAELKECKSSRKAYHKAIAQQSDQYLAYQGLVNLYTKHWAASLTPEDTDDLIAAYEKLIKLLGSQDKKTEELQLGLTKAYLGNKKFSLCLDTVKSALQELQHCGNGDVNPVLSSFYDEVLHCFKLVGNDYSQLHDYSDLLCQTLFFFHDNDFCNKFYELFKIFILFHQVSEEHATKDLNTIVITVQKLISKNWKNIFMGHCIMQLYWQDSQYFSEEIVKDYLNSIPSENNSLINAFKGFQAFVNKDYESCVSLLSPLLKEFQDFLPLKLTLSKTYLALQKWQDCEKLSRVALQDCKRLQSAKLESTSDWRVRISSVSSLKLNFSFLFATSLSNSQSKEMLELSINTFERLSKVWPDSVDVYLGITRAQIALKNLSGAKTALDQANKLNGENPETKSWMAYIEFLEGEQNSVTDLQNVVTNNPDCFVAHFLFGKILFSGNSSQKGKAFKTFLKAAKLNVYHGPTFLYIGHYYRDVMKNSAKALRCYEKAYSLGSKDEETGSALADQYISEGNLNAAISLYESITQQASTGECKWAWLRLGLCQLKNDEINAAIRSLIAAQRCDMNDHITWECLGEAYFHRGSFTSAWKSFNRAHELEPTSVYSLYQMAAIKQILCRYSEAVAEYNDALQLSPGYLPALKGLGESHLSLARFMLSEGRYMTCVDHVNESIRYLSLVVTTRTDLSCVWKLLGDCMTIIQPLDDSKVFLTVPQILLGNSSSENNKLTKAEILHLGGKFYIQALRVHNSALLWHDLGLNYFYQAQAGGANRADLAASAVQMLQKGLSLEEQNHVLWNSLGIVAASDLVKNLSLAQHCFIRSIQYEPNNVEAWSNLGVFYLHQSQIELAHQAFKNAQSLSPSFANSWIGQAIIAESIGSDDAMDLFRHATELSLHDEAGIGYARWVANLICECHENRKQSKYKENIHDLHALSAATVQMSKYCDLHPNCAWAFGLYGFLLEETGLNRFAEIVYKRSLDLIATKLNECQEGDSSLISMNDRVNLDYARVLFKNKKFTEAVNIYQSITNLNDYSSLCGFALSLLACGMLDEACAALNQALLAATSSDHQALVHIALALLSWKKGDLDDAVKRLLPHQNKSYNVNLCLCLLALNSNNDHLLQSLVPHLHSCDVTERDSHDVMHEKALIISCALARTSNAAARCYLQKCIHKFPNNYRFRHLLSRHLSHCNQHKLAYLSSEQSLLNYQTDDRTLSTETHSNHISPQQCIDQHRLVSTSHAFSCLANGIHSTVKGADRDSLKAAQRLAHRHPYSTQSWSLLGGSAYAKAVLSKFNNVCSTLISIPRKLLAFVVTQSNSKLHAWAVKQKVVSGFLEEQYDSSGLSEIGDNEAEALLSIVEGRDVSLSDNNQSSYFAVMLNCHSLTRLGHIEKTFNYLQTVLSSDKQHTLKYKPYLAMLALHLSVSQPSKSGDWLKKADKLLCNAGNSTLIQLIHGFVMKKMKSLKKSSTLLNKVFTSRHIEPLCLSRSIAAWFLYLIYHGKNDSVMIEKLLNQWSQYNDPMMEEIVELLPNS